MESAQGIMPKVLILGDFRTPSANAPHLAAVVAGANEAGWEALPTSSTKDALFFLGNTVALKAVIICMNEGGQPSPRALLKQTNGLPVALVSGQPDTMAELSRPNPHHLDALLPRDDVGPAELGEETAAWLEEVHRGQPWGFANGNAQA